MNTQILYCPKCGWIEYPSPFQQSDNYCEVCGHNLLIPNDKYDLNLKNYMNGVNINTGITLKQNQQRLFEEVIKPNPEFDPDLYARKDEIIKQKQEQEMNEFRRQTGGASWVDDKIGYKPKCPTCGSTNIKKISVGSKIVGAGLFGIFSKTARSQFKCNDCGYKW